jgi:hypothetical protein
MQLVSISILHAAAAPRRSEVLPFPAFHSSTKLQKKTIGHQIPIQV